MAHNEQHDKIELYIDQSNTDGLNAAMNMFSKLLLWTFDTNRDGIPKWYVNLRRKLVRTITTIVIDVLLPIHQCHTPR